MSAPKKSAVILDGKMLADKIKKELAIKIKKSAKRPGLAAILVGDNPASSLYIKLKEKACREVGINFHKYLCNQECCGDISEKELIDLIVFLNQDPETDGIIVQLPLPEKYDQQKIISAISPDKDVDGFHLMNQTGLIPPTINAIIELLKATKKDDLEDKSALIIGKSDIFISGIEKHLQEILNIKNIKLAKNIPDDAADFEIIIIALGQARALKKSMVKLGAIVIDVGINQKEGKTVGDVDPMVQEVAGFVSPVPGGVGPLTVACLLRNVYLLSQKKK